MDIYHRINLDSIMKTIPNASAFPHDRTFGAVSGITTREYFAAMAMQGLLSSCTGDQWPDMIDVAAKATKAADALIDALNTVNPITP